MFLTQKRTRSRQSTLAYGYDARWALVSAISDVNPDYAYAYGFDEAGNRNSASEAGRQLAYTTNALNQYASVSEGEVPFVPEYDLDGNATRLRTSTGTWSVEYNAHNRPVAWRKSTGEVVYMIYDAQGRRAEKRVLNAAGKRTLRERYVYVGYTCVQVLNGDKNNALVKEFAWDPTEPTATRPLTFRYAEKSLMLFYAFDGNKNVSDVFFLALQNGIGAHYEYAPFGAIVRTAKATSSKVDLIGANPWRFSSEFYDSELDLVYYNYRHYSPALGRWLSRDPIEEEGGKNLYCFLDNIPTNSSDILGNRPHHKRIGKIEARKKAKKIQIKEGKKYCANYIKFYETTCCRNGVEEKDDYPKKAKEVCDGFIEKYAGTIMGQGAICVANCLSLSEERMTKVEDCAERNSSRLTNHFSCYAQCLFVPILWLPPGGWDVGAGDLLPDFWETFF